MAYTKKYTVTSAARVNIVAQTVCTRIQIAEDASAWVNGVPTTDFFIAKPNGGTQLQYKAGEAYSFVREGRACFQPGEIVGDIEAVSATSTFAQDESGR